MYSNIDWARLQGQLDALEEIRPGDRVKSPSPKSNLRRGFASRPSDIANFKPVSTWDSVSLHDPTCHILGNEARIGNTSNKITGN